MSSETKSTNKWDALKSLPNLGKTDGTPRDTQYENMVRVFDPHSGWTWYLWEVDSKTGDLAFGFVKGFEHELGYVSVEELKRSITSPQVESLGPLSRQEIGCAY